MSASPDLPARTVPTAVVFIDLQEGFFEDAQTRDDREILIRDAGARRLVLAGLTAESCVAATGRDAFARDFEVVYARWAIASSTAEVGWTLLEHLSSDYRQVILDRPDLQRLLAPPTL